MERESAKYYLNLFIPNHTYMAEVYSKNVKGELVISDNVPVQKVCSLQSLEASLANSKARLVIKQVEVVSLETEIKTLSDLITEAKKLGVS